MLYGCAEGGLERYLVLEREHPLDGEKANNKL